jgi:hypothetical protein
VADSPEESAEVAEARASLRRVQEELRRVEEAVSELTGLPSNWNGNVELRLEPGWRGMKPFHCDIRLDSARQTLDVRWRTHLHEMLHAHSAGYTRPAFEDYPGWEEGVVEKLQRLLRPRVLERLGLGLPETVFVQEDAEHEYNPYVEAIDSLSRFLKQPQESEADFYVALLSTPISQRIAWTHAQGKQVPPQEFGTFLRAFAAANATLRRKLRT